MKTLALLLASLLVATPLAFAQDELYGTIRATTKIRPDGSKSTTITDPDKRTAEETITDARDKVLRKTTYLLGDDDLATGAIFRDAKGKIIYKANYERDGAGHVTTASFSDPNDRYLGKRVFVYGAAGDQATQVVDYDANGQVIQSSQPASKAKKHH